MFRKTLLAISVGLVFTMLGCGGGGGSSPNALAGGNAAPAVEEGDDAPPSDNVAPVITLAGDNPTIVPIGTPYAEEGANASDDIDGDFSATATGSINTAVAGKYTISYSAEDTAGNIANVVDRVVKVEPPSSVGTKNLQVVNEKLFLISYAAAAGEAGEFPSYGLDLSDAIADNVLGSKINQLQTITADLSLEESLLINGSNTTAHLGFVIEFVSASDSSLVSRISLSFQENSTSLISKALISSNDEKLFISDLDNLVLTKATPIKFQLAIYDSGTPDFAKVSIGETVAIIPLADLPAGDMVLSKLSYSAYLNNATIGSEEYVSGSVDNIKLGHLQDNALRVVEQNFDGYRDGRAPLANEDFNLVNPK